MRRTDWTRLETYLLARRDLAPSTTGKTLRALRLLERDGLCLTKPSRRAYDAFLARRKREGRDGPGLRHYARAMRHLLAFHGTTWPDFHLPRCPTSPRDILPDRTVRALLEYDDQGGDELDGAAARFSFRLGFYTAMRCPSEHHDLDVDDFDQDHGTLRVWSDKVERYRVLQLEPWLADYVRAYIDTTRAEILSASSTWRTSRSTSLILNPKNGRAFSREGYRMWLWRHGLTVHKRFRVSDMRHWGATWRLLETNLDVYSVKEWLGHSAVSSTEHYLHVARAELRKRMAARQIQPLTLRDANASS